MDWRSAKILIASTATVAIVSQLVKKLYTNYFSANIIQGNEQNCDQLINVNRSTREINDVLIFSNDNVASNSHTCNEVPTKNERLHDREINCIKLIQYLHAARETLDVCMYLITSPEIVEQIIRLGQKHVLVRILVDHDMAFTPPSQIKRLMEYSFIQVQTTKQTILMHHKFCVIDGPKAIKRKIALKTHAEEINVHIQPKQNYRKHQKHNIVKGFVMSGSLNWSTQAMLSNHESVIVTSHSNIVDKFEKEFEALWTNNEPVFKRSKLYISG